jgi:hypothetical protein
VPGPFDALALLVSGIKKTELIPTFSLQIESIADLTGAMHICAPHAQHHARALNRRSPYLRTVQHFSLMRESSVFEALFNVFG